MLAELSLIASVFVRTFVATEQLLAASAPITNQTLLALDMFAPRDAASDCAERARGATASRRGIGIRRFQKFFVSFVVPASRPRSSEFRIEPRARAASRSLPDISQNHVRRLLAHHVDRAGDEEAGDSREHRGIDHAQAGGAVHLQRRREDAAALG